VFVEDGVFSVDEARTIFEAGKKLSLPGRVHAEQLGHLGGAALAAEIGAASADCNAPRRIGPCRRGCHLCPGARCCLHIGDSPAFRPLALGCGMQSGPGYRLQPGDLVHGAAGSGDLPWCGPDGFDRR
jgi:hypothetical protein